MLWLIRRGLLCRRVIFNLCNKFRKLTHMTECSTVQGGLLYMRCPSSSILDCSTSYNYLVFLLSATDNWFVVYKGTFNFFNSFFQPSRKCYFMQKTDILSLKMLEDLSGLSKKYRMRITTQYSKMHLFEYICMRLSVLFCTGLWFGYILYSNGWKKHTVFLKKGEMY